jgi:hypothetical protein
LAGTGRGKLKRPVVRRNLEEEHTMLHRRRVGVSLIAAAVAIPLAIAATAFACANLATLKLSRGAVAAGGDVTAYGRNYNSNPASSPVTLRFNGRAGRVLFEGRPAANGKLTGTFKAPADVRAGRYVIVATQTGPDGRPAAGTPGRAPLRIRAGGSATVVAPPAGTSTPTLPSAPAAIGLAALMLGLAGGGVALVGGARRRSAASA